MNIDIESVQPESRLSLDDCNAPIKCVVVAPSPVNNEGSFNYSQIEENSQKDTVVSCNDVNTWPKTSIVDNESTHHSSFLNTSGKRPLLGKKIAAGTRRVSLLGRALFPSSQQSSRRGRNRVQGLNSKVVQFDQKKNGNENDQDKEDR